MKKSLATQEGLNQLVPCKICDHYTINRFNINLEAIPVCEECANSITLQQVKWLVHNDTWEHKNE